MKLDTNYGDFYKDKFFTALKDDICRIEILVRTYQENSDKKFLIIGDKIDRLDKNMKYIYGFAGGVAFVFSFIIDWFKNKIWNG